MQIEVTEVTTDDVSAVELHIGTYSAKGSSKRHPKDPPNSHLGQQLALARACSYLANQLYADAYNTIEHITIGINPGTISEEGINGHHSH